MKKQIKDIEENEDRIKIQEIVKKLDIAVKNITKFAEGTNSRVYLLNNEYTIKFNTHIDIKAECEFAKRNRNKLFQDMIHCDQEYDYIIYRYISGKTMKKDIEYDDLIIKLKYIIDNYPDFDKSGYGFIYYEDNSWIKFLKKYLEFHKERVEYIINGEEILKNSINILEKYDFNKKLLHGDLGAHNFIINKENKLVGIIDPSPIIGDKLYDFIFAILSNKYLINKINLDYIFEILDEPKEKIKSMLIIVLYIMISRTLRYHIEDLEYYKNQWNKFKYL